MGHVILMANIGVSISVFELIIATLVFTSLLIIFFIYQQISFEKLVTFILLFLWFTFAIGATEWWGNLLPIQSDSYGHYFARAQDIAESGLELSVIEEQYAETNSLAHMSFIILEAIFLYVSGANYISVHIWMIFLSTLAVFYAWKCGQLLIANGTIYRYTILGFVLYFAWYWSVLQNLREAPIMLLLGGFLLNYLLWWRTAKARHGLFTIILGIFIVILRNEMAILMATVVGLTVLVQNPTFIKRFGKAFVLIPITVAVTLQFIPVSTGDDILRTINGAREVRWRSGQGYQATDIRIESYQELMMQAPHTFRFFLVPIWPWQVDAGKIYVRAYVHSLSALALILVAIRGIWCYFQGYVGNPLYRKPMLVLLLAFTATAGVFSLGEIGASAAARHATFFYYFLLAGFVPIGLSLFFQQRQPRTASFAENG